MDKKEEADLAAWALWAQKQKLDPNSHLPVLKRAFSSAMTGDITPFLQMTAYVVRAYSGYSCYKLIPNQGVWKDQALTWEFRDQDPRNIIHKSIALLESTEPYVESIVGWPYPTSSNVFTKMGFHNVKIVPAKTTPPPVDASFFQVNNEYGYSSYSWAYFQVVMGLMGPKRVQRCIEGMTYRLQRINQKGSFFSLIAEATEQSIQTINEWSHLGVPPVRLDMLHDQTDIRKIPDYYMESSSRVMRIARSYCLLAAYEADWMPPKQWMASEAQDFHTLTSKLSRNVK